MDRKPYSKAHVDESAEPSKKRNRTNRKDVELSKALSWVLRHAEPSSLGLSMTLDGYVPIQGLLESGHPRFKGVTMEDIQKVVDENDKQRFRICTKRFIVHSDDAKSKNKARYTFITDEDSGSAGGEGQDMLCIRANQGHSIATGISSDELLQRLSPEELASIDTIVHGTTWIAWDQHIKREGLCRMKRHHIHFATGIPGEDTSVISGMRSSSDVYIYIDSKKCASDGVIFYKSDNNVLLTSGINGYLSPLYFKKVIHATTLKVLMPCTNP